MNRFLSLALVVLSAFAASSIEARSLRMEVNGLVCAFCADGISRAFKKQAATADIFVSLEDRLVAVQLKDGEDISDDVARKLLTDAGYTVVGITRTDATVAEIKAEVGRE